MTAIDRIETHDQVVARRIVDRLVAVGLLPPAYADKTAKRLCEGTMKAEHWRLLAGKALELDNQEGDDDQATAR